MIGHRHAALLFRTIYPCASRTLATKYPPPSEAGAYRDPIEFMKEEFKHIGKGERKLPVDRETDIAVIGGGLVGSAVAYWLKQRNPEGFKVHVIERDDSYTRASSTLSVGGVRQQFSLKENIQMSLFMADFIRNIKSHLSIIDKDPPDIQFNPQGYLFLASEKGEDIMRKNHQLQIDNGAKVELMDRDQLKEKFPWMNTEDVKLGSYGIQNEGWLDPWCLLTAFRAKAQSLGAIYTKGEVVAFNTRDALGTYSMHGQNVVVRRNLYGLQVKSAVDGVVYPMNFMAVINCAGPWAGHVAKLAGIGIGDGVLQVPLPVEPRKRFVYVLHCPDGPGLETPLLIDGTGVYVRREGMGGNYLCGVSPDPNEEPSTESLDVDYEFFENKIWPVLAHRVPAFEKLKADTDHSHDGVEIRYFREKVFPALVSRIPAFKSLQLKSAWAGFYDYNYFDQNLVIGNHPYHRNFYFANGCSGHGLQQASAIGRAIMELIVDSEYKTIDLSRFSFDRILDNKPLFEENIV